jgi:2-amino-4-hydroxy-6-hydroxymethyldihydropteridine diphosphokinase
MARVGIALGSNLGDRLSNLKAARRCLQEIATPGSPFLSASIYQSEPMHCPLGSPPFYNSVVEIGFHGTPSALLKITQSIERKLGRIATAERNAPRIIDIDLLYFGRRVMGHPDLQLPHPRIAERSFVLQPLAEIRPHWTLPGQAHSIASMIDLLQSDARLEKIIED